MNTGRFIITRRRIVEYPDGVRCVFKGMVVMEARYRMDIDATEYMAEGAMFEPVADGDIAPWYNVEVDANRVATFTIRGTDDRSSN